MSKDFLFRYVYYTVNNVYASQMILYESDAVQADFTDGSRILVSPCGAVFVHQQRHHGHVLQGPRCIQQKSRFSTSQYRTKVLQALEFRNRFAERPYICGELLGQQSTMVVFSDITTVRWPTKCSPEYCQTLESGHIQISSIDNHACLTLSPHQQDFSVQFLAKLSKDRPRKSFKRPLRDLNTGSGDIQKGAQESLACKRKNVSWQDSASDVGQRYTYVVQSHSVNKCPDIWRHPLSLALEFICKSYSSTNHEILDSTVVQKECDNHNLYDHNYYGKDWPLSNLSQEKECLDLELKGKRSSQCKSNGVQNGDSKINCSDIAWAPKDIKSPHCPVVNCWNESCVDNPDIVCTPLPQSLPLSCDDIHLHKVALSHHADLDMDESSDRGGMQRMENIKIVCSAGVVYRFVAGKRVEVLPGDGSIIKSMTSAGGYYIHHKMDCLNGEKPITVERTFSVTNPPPDTKDLPYSMSKVIKRADRLLKVVSEERLLLSSVMTPVCWKVADLPTTTLPPPTTLLEEMTVDGVGHFRAYSSGRVRVVFSDRTSLDMFHNFQQSQENVEKLKTSFKQHQNHSPNGVCRLLLPNGEYKNVHVDNPGYLYRYTSLATEWCQWVDTPSSLRSDFYSKQPEIPSVEAELLKIKTFNYILSNTSVTQGFEQHSIGQSAIVDDTLVNSDMVQKALHRSSQWLQETDKLLNKSGCK